METFRAPALATDEVYNALSFNYTDNPNKTVLWVVEGLKKVWVCDDPYIFR